MHPVLARISGLQRLVHSSRSDRAARLCKRVEPAVAERNDGRDGLGLF
jgi:hypothetical protein